MQLLCATLLCALRVALAHLPFNPPSPVDPSQYLSWPGFVPRFMTYVNSDKQLHAAFLDAEITTIVVVTDITVGAAWSSSSTVTVKRDVRVTSDVQDPQLQPSIDFQFMKNRLKLANGTHLTFSRVYLHRFTSDAAMTGSKYVWGAA